MAARPQKSLTRRTFAKTIAAAAALPMLGGAVAPPSGGDAPPSAPPAPGASGTGPSARPQGAQEPGATARALAQIVRERHGSRLTEEQLTAITADLERAVRRSATLRQTQLANGDEPAFVFSAYRGRS